MRQFLIGGATYPSGAVDAANPGLVGFAYLDKSDNKLKFTSDPVSDTGDGEFYLVYTRSNEQQGNVVLPLHKNHFSFVKGEFDDSKSGKFSAEFTITDVDPFLDYTVIIVKKGKQFNERNKWTATVHSKPSDTPATIASKLAEVINNNKGAEVEATVSTATITIQGLVDDQDYKIVLADELIDVEVENVNNVMKAYGSWEYIKDLADKCAADAGIEYTYQDDVSMLYPLYPFGRGLGDEVAPEGFTVFTIRCAEPRDVKTRDEVVHQIIQVAFPMDSEAIITFGGVCSELLDNSRML